VIFCGRARATSAHLATTHGTNTNALSICAGQQYWGGGARQLSSRLFFVKLTHTSCRRRGEKEEVRGLSLRERGFKTRGPVTTSHRLGEWDRWPAEGRSSFNEKREGRSSRARAGTSPRLKASTRAQERHRVRAIGKSKAPGGTSGTSAVSATGNRTLELGARGRIREREPRRRFQVERRITRAPRSCPQPGVEPPKTDSSTNSKTDSPKASQYPPRSSRSQRFRQHGRGTPRGTPRGGEQRLLASFRHGGDAGGAVGGAPAGGAHARGHAGDGVHLRRGGGNRR
jgi:hypothetical protein